MKLSKTITTKQHQWKTTSTVENLNGWPQWKMTSMEDDLNRRQLQWKTTSMQDDLNWWWPQFKTTSVEDDLDGRWHQWKTTLIKDNVRQPQWKMNSMKDNLNERRPQLKTTSMKDDLNGNIKGLTLAWLARQFCTELGPAQPQLVSTFSYKCMLNLNNRIWRKKVAKRKRTKLLVI